MGGEISGHTTYLLSAASLTGFLFWLITKLAQRAYLNSNLPPGPRGLPLIGDVRHMSDRKWLVSPKRKDDYGDFILTMFPRSVLMHWPGEMMYISALGKGALIMNSQRVAVDLLEKRSNIYSGRPRYISAGEYLTENLTFILSPYCDLYAVDTQLYFLAHPPY